MTAHHHRPARAPGVTLVLFDIDGTILSAGGAGRRAIHAALREIFGGIGPEGHRFDGKTDPQIVRELMRLDGHSDATIDERMQSLLSRYADLLEQELAAPHARPHVYPGVVELVDALERRDDVVLGLLAGNLERGAVAKLRAAGMDPQRFAVSAFGSDAEHRPDLPAIAQRRAEERLGLRLFGTSIVVIGDTPADVQCGHGIGARAIGVGTGQYGLDELASCGADAVFATLEDTAAVLDVIVPAHPSPASR